MFNLALKSAKASLAWLIKLLKAIGDKLKKGTKAVTNGIKEFFEELKKALDEIFPKWRKEKVYSLNERYKLLYKRPESLYVKPFREKIVTNYGEIVGKLFDKVELEWNNVRKNLSGNKRGELVLISGMVDIETNKISKLFTNFTKMDLKRNEHLKFLEQLHPTLKKRLNEHLKRRGKSGERLNLENPEVIKFAWKQINIPHAEFRALDDLLKQIDKNGILGEKAFKKIIGYNSFLRKEGIPHICADCFYLTHGVTYIK